MPEDSFAVPFTFRALQDVVDACPDVLLAWDLSPEVIAFFGADGDVALPYLRTEPVRGQTEDGSAVRVFLTSEDHLEDVVIPGLASVGIVVLRIESMEQEQL